MGGDDDGSLTSAEALRMKDGGKGEEVVKIAKDGRKYIIEQGLPANCVKRSSSPKHAFAGHVRACSAG